MAAKILPFKAQEAPIKNDLHRLRDGMIHFLSGKDEIVDAMLATILSSGHVLLEDVPGVGKTTAIRAISKLLGLEMKRIQCTSDLLPSDIIGNEVFDSRAQNFVFHQGPIFANLILADELNRASPRTQSALLEAMGEGLVTVDRKTYSLPTPFILFASQNPSEHVGCYPLPESQLDRFSVKIQLNYPVAEKEKEIFSLAARDPVKQIESNVIDKSSLERLQQDAEKVHISDNVSVFVKKVVDVSRSHPKLRRGISTRGGVTWLRLARAMALIRERDYVVPDDLIDLAPICLAHRVVSHDASDATSIISSLFEKVEIE